MHILLLGSGGREHALAWKMALSPLVEKVHVLPGNAGMTGENIACVSGDAMEVAARLKPSLIVVGPEKPMAEGVTDALEAKGFAVLGASKAAAQLESSKVFSKAFMQDVGIPTAKAVACEGYDAAFAALKGWDVEAHGVVIKADGLAAGKGVVVTHSRAEAEETLRLFLKDETSAIQDTSVLLEEVLKGREVSAFALCDGEDFIPLGYICDYKRIYDGDKGPNTGGMGCYAPQGWPSDAVKDFVNKHVFARVLAGMKARGTPFKGILFAGLMVDGEDVKVIEFNVRFGDPETQTLLPLLEGDVVPLFLAAAEGRLKGTSPLPVTGASVHVVMASKGYPAVQMQLGGKIEDKGAGGQVFYAGVKQEAGALVNAGGRVLGVTALGATVQEARQKAYARVEGISFSGAQWRRDIGERA